MQLSCFASRSRASITGGFFRFVVIAILCGSFFTSKLAAKRIDGYLQWTSCQQESDLFFNVADSKLLGGYGGFISSLLWVDVIFSYVGVIIDGDSGENLPASFKQAYNADPLWETPLIVGVWAVSGLNDVDPRNVIWLMEEGADKFPQNWRFRIAWAVYLQECNCIDSGEVSDSVAKILIPLSGRHVGDVPDYARGLAFTLLHKNGKADQAMDIIIQSYQQVPDPLVRHQFQRKIGDLLWRNEVFLGADSSAFIGGVGSMLGADPIQAGAAKALLIRLVQPETKDAALLDARHLARQFRAYQAAQLGVPQ